MTTHPIDTEALAKRAGHILFTDGPEQPAATARETCVLLDQIAAAEQRIRDLAQEVRDERGAALDLIEQVKIRDARIKAVEDVLDGHTKPTDRIGDLPGMIRRALDA